MSGALPPLIQVPSLCGIITTRTLCYTEAGYPTEQAHTVHTDVYNSLLTEMPNIYLIYLTRLSAAHTTQHTTRG
jgi:hypothetical protein